MDFFFKTNPNNLDPSYQMDLDFLDCFAAKLCKTDLGTVY